MSAEWLKKAETFNSRDSFRISVFPPTLLPTCLLQSCQQYPIPHPTPLKQGTFQPICQTPNPNVSLRLWINGMLLLRAVGLVLALRLILILLLCFSLTNEFFRLPSSGLIQYLSHSWTITFLDYSPPVRLHLHRRCPSRMYRTVDFIPSR